MTSLNAVFLMLLLQEPFKNIICGRCVQILGTRLPGQLSFCMVMPNIVGLQDGTCFMSSCWQLEV
jgi:hypothetical protein